MKSSKIFVLPSTREGFPNTILEANSCGLPAIIVRHNKNAGVSVVKNGYNGFVVNLSPKEIAEKIIYLLQNYDVLKTLSKNSIEFAKKYDWSIIVRRLLDVYSEVCWMKIEGKRVLVTGSAGFIGSLVEEEADVIVVDDLKDGDIRNLAESMDKIEGYKIDRLDRLI